MPINTNDSINFNEIYECVTIRNRTLIQRRFIMYFK